MWLYYEIPRYFVWPKIGYELILNIILCNFFFFLNALFYQDGQNGSQNGQEISQMFEEQQRTIENLEAQVTSKDRKIQQLEDQIKQLSMPLKPESF